MPGGDDNRQQASDEQNVPQLQDAGRPAVSKVRRERADHYADREWNQDRFANDEGNVRKADIVIAMEQRSKQFYRKGNKQNGDQRNRHEEPIDKACPPPEL